MKKKLKKAAKLLFSFFFALLMSVNSAFAVDGDLPILGTDDLQEVEEEKLGSISITLEDTEDKLSKAGVVFAIVKVADIEKGLYVLQDDLQSTNIDLNTIETSKELTEASIVLKNAVSGYDETVTTDNNGYCIFENLQVGVYLIYPLDTADYEDIAPFMIGIPTFDELQKEMIYDVDVLPKHAPHPTISVLKVDADDQTKVLKNAEFTLYDANKNALQTVHTDAKGVAQFFNVKDGTYYLKETAAPKGYQLSKDEVKVVINDEYDSGHVYKVTVTNTLLPAIKTGDTANFGIFASTGIAALSCAVILISKKQKDKKEIEE